VTTIAYTMGKLAADRMCCYGNEYKQSVSKIAYAYNDDYQFLVALAGVNREHIDSIAQKICESDDLESVDIEGIGEDADLIVIRKGESVEVFHGDNEGIYQFPEDQPFAIGSGASIAMSEIVNHGRDAVGAVKAASRVDIFTGMGIDWYDLFKKDLEVTHE